jgi:hypothetical protein
MLHVVPARWSDPLFAPFLQLGVTPQKDEAVFYLGLGFAGESRFSFGLGLAMVEVPKLSGGLKVGDALAAAADLKTTTEFKSGLYVHFTVNIP